jgi:hypothetical protein
VYSHDREFKLLTNKRCIRSWQIRGKKKYLTLWVGLECLLTSPLSNTRSVLNLLNGAIKIASICFEIHKFLLLEVTLDVITNTSWKNVRFKRKCFHLLLPRFCCGLIYHVFSIIVHEVSKEGRSIFWEIIVSVILSKNMYMYMCPVPNGSRDRATSYVFHCICSQTVDKKQILRTVSSTGIYCSGDKVGTVCTVYSVLHSEIALLGNRSE